MNASGQHRFYAHSTETGYIYNVPYRPTTTDVAPDDFLDSLDESAGMVASREITQGPRSLYILEGNRLLQGRITPSGIEQAQSPLTLPYTPAGMFDAGSREADRPAAMAVYNRTQTVAEGASAFPLPIVARLFDSTGLPVPNAPVTFTPSIGLSLESAATTTDSEGYAVATPSVPAAAGTFRVDIVSGSVRESATLRVGSGGGGGTADVIEAYSGHGQTVQLPFVIFQPFIARVLNPDGTPAGGVEVTFSLPSSEYGRLMGSAATCTVEGLVCTILTASDGTASIQFVASQHRVLIRQFNISASIAGGSQAEFPVTILSNSANLLRDLTKPRLGTVAEFPANSVVRDAIRVLVRISDSTGLRPVSGIGVSASTEFSDDDDGPTVVCANGNGTALTGEDGIAVCDLRTGPITGQAHMSVNIGGRIQDRLIRIVPGVQSSFAVISGDNQTATLNQTLAPMVAELRDGSGAPRPNIPVQWEVSSGSGITFVSSSQTTDANGRATATAKLGSVAGAHQVTVRLTGSDATAVFRVTATAEVGQMTIVSGNNQIARIGTDFAQPLVVKLTGQNGSPMVGTMVNFTVSPAGSVTLTPSSAVTNTNGEASVAVRAGSTAADVTVTASGAGATQAFTLSVRDRVPVISLEGLLDAASFQAMRRVGPGQLLTITGTGIATGVNGVVQPSPVGPLPTELAGVKVTFGGIAAPIYHVANLDGREQVTVKVPFEVAPGNTTIVLTADGIASEPIANVPVTSYSPGIFETGPAGSRYAIVFREDGTYVTPESPARRGELLRFFAHGLGQTTPATATNRACLDNQVVSGIVVVGVNASGAGRVTAECVEGMSGLYLVTFEVPPNLQFDSNLVPLVVRMWVSPTEMYDSAASRLPITQ
jgi:uncharacterized protein (TIGR03437 family)